MCAFMCITIVVILQASDYNKVQLVKKISRYKNNYKFSMLKQFFVYVLITGYQCCNIQLRKLSKLSEEHHQAE